MENGVVLLALNNKKYFYMACNLAVSIKVNNPSLNIGLYHDKESKIDGEISKIGFSEKLFDIIKPVKKKYYEVDGEKEIGYLKNNLYFISPFEKTLYLDVDTLIFNNNNIRDLFSLIDNKPFYFPSVSSKKIKNLSKNKSQLDWFKFTDVKKYFNKNIDEIEELKSYFFLMRKSQEAEDFFRRSVDYFKLMKEGKFPLSFNWYQGIPDEPSFQLSLHENKDYKKYTTKKNVLFNHFEGEMEPKVEEDYYGITYSGHKISGSDVMFYEKKNRKNFRKLSVPYETELKYNFENI